MQNHSSIEDKLNNTRTLLRGPKRVVSLRGIAKSLVSDEELENSIKEAKKSLLKGADDVSVVWRPCGRPADNHRDRSIIVITEKDI